MYFIISLSNRDDEVVMHRPSCYVFDVERYIRPSYNGLVERVMRFEVGEYGTHMMECVMEYLNNYRHDTTYNILSYDTDAHIDACYTVKKMIHSSISTYNTHLTLMLVAKYKMYVIDSKKIYLYIHMVCIIKMMKVYEHACRIGGLRAERGGAKSEKEMIVDISKYMNRYMSRYKGERVEVVDNEGKVVDVDMKVRSVL